VEIGQKGGEGATPPPTPPPRHTARTGRKELTLAGEPSIDKVRGEDIFQSGGDLLIKRVRADSHSSRHTLKPRTRYSLDVVRVEGDSRQPNVPS